MIYTTYYVRHETNTHDKIRYKLTRIPLNTAKVAMYSTPMIYLLKHAPNGDLPTSTYTTEPSIIKVYKGQSEPNVVVYVKDDDMWFYLIGNINCLDRNDYDMDERKVAEEELRTKFKAKYDYQLWIKKTGK